MLMGIICGDGKLQKLLSQGTKTRFKNILFFESSMYCNKVLPTTLRGIKL